MEMSMYELDIFPLQMSRELRMLSAVCAIAFSGHGMAYFTHCFKVNGLYYKVKQRCHFI